MREASAAQLHVVAIVSPVGKSDPPLDLQTAIIFGDNGGIKINKFLDCLENLVIGRYLTSNTSLYHKLYFVLIYCKTHVSRLPFKRAKGKNIL